MAKHNGGCPYSGACKCSCGPCKTAVKHQDHCGSHGSGCHLDCAR